MQNIAVFVGQYLHFDMSGVVEIFFYVYFGTAKIAGAFALGTGQGAFCFFGFAHHS